MSSQIKYDSAIQEFWERIADAADEPEQGDLRFLLSCLDRVLEICPPEQRLDIAGRAIAQLATIYHKRSTQQLDDWEEAQRDGDLLMADDLLHGLVQETMYLDLSELTRQPKQRQRKAVKPNPDDSVVGVVDKQKLLNAVDSFAAGDKTPDVSHDEAVSDWVEAIAAYLKQHSQPIALPELQQRVPLPLVEIWLGLLLGGFNLEKHGEFYENDTLSITL